MSSYVVVLSSVVMIAPLCPIGSLHGIEIISSAAVPAVNQL